MFCVLCVLCAVCFVLCALCVSRLCSACMLSIRSPFVCAQDDWEDDAQGAEVLSQHQFMESMFMFADNWTATTKEEEYVCE